MRKYFLAALVIVLAAFAVSAYFYTQLPEKMVSHWNINGEADGYMEKGVGVLLLPVISLGLLALFAAIPRIDPKKQNIKEFGSYYGGFVIVFTMFLLYVHMIIITWNLGVKFQFTQAFVPAIGGLFYYIGVLVSHAKKNYFIGIRTPWTLSSERVWNKTHKMCGRVFRICGVIAIAGALTDYAFYLVIVPAIAAAIFAYVYSYFIYRKIKLERN